MRSVARVARVAARARDARGRAETRDRDRGGVRARWRARRSGSRGVARDAVWEPRAREKRGGDANDRAVATRGREMETFAHEGATTANLGAWLARRGVAVEKFDRARGTKNLEDLLIELKSGESVLVSERERVEMNTYIAVCALVGFVLGIFGVGSPIRSELKNMIWIIKLFCGGTEQYIFSSPK